MIVKKVSLNADGHVNEAWSIINTSTPPIAETEAVTRQSDGDPAQTQSTWSRGGLDIGWQTWKWKNQRDGRD